MITILIREAGYTHRETNANNGNLSLRIYSAASHLIVIIVAVTQESVLRTVLFNDIQYTQFFL